MFALPPGAFPRKEQFVEFVAQFPRSHERTMRRFGGAINAYEVIWR